MKTKAPQERGMVHQFILSFFSRGGARRLTRNLFLDLRYGNKLLGGDKISQHTDKGFLHTMNTDYHVMQKYFSLLEISEGDVIVDVGCGKGRLFNLLLHLGFKNRLIGVEVDSAVATFTKNRLRKYPNIEILECDVTALEKIPGTIFYLFNPFTRPVMEKFVRKLEQQWLQQKDRKNRPIVIYQNCLELAAFEESGNWKIRKKFSPEESEAKGGSAILELRP